MTVRNAYLRGSRPESRQCVADAFLNLRRAGIYARMRILCCRECAAAALRRRFSENRHAYFSATEDEAAKRTGSLRIFFGSTKPQNAARRADFEVGVRVVDALKTVGLEVEWDGDPERCITVATPRWGAPRRRGA